MRSYTTLAVLSSFCLLFFVSNVYAAYEISDGSVLGLYNFEDLVDSSGNGNNLTDNGSVTFTEGKLGDAATFSGNNNDYLYNGTVLTSQTFSECMWIKLTTGATQTLVGHTSSGENSELYVNSVGTLSFYDTGGRSANTAVTTATWEFRCFTKNGSGGAYAHYYNGEADGSGTAGNQVPGDIYIGNYRSGDSPANGQIDELLLTNNVLSSDTILALYNEGVGSEICVLEGCGSNPTSTTPSSTVISIFDITKEQTTDVLAYLMQGVTFGLMTGLFGAIMLRAFKFVFRSNYK